MYHCSYMASCCMVSKREDFNVISWIDLCPSIREVLLSFRNGSVKTIENNHITVTIGHRHYFFLIVLTAFPTKILLFQDTWVPGAVVCHAFPVFVLVHSTAWRDQSCSCVDEVSTWWQISISFLFQSCSYQLNSEILRAQFGNQMTLNNQEMVAETRSYISRWCSWFWCWRPYLSFLKSSSLRSRN